jgi:dihydrofolate synthase / folylpolyglutamate synthase
MTYRKTLEYLFAQLPMYQRIGAAAYKADLGNTIALCRVLGNPEKRFRSIHIAGTNGKGSTSHMIASVLQSAGYKTGLYTSPHLKDFRERIKINGKMIPKSYVSKFVQQNKKSFGNFRPSFFEYTAVMSFQYFAEEKVDIAVIETGMGGRLDSTNVITPLVSVITNISKDHTAFLGDTLPEIAKEKAGIIKPGIPLVIGETQSDTSQVFLRKAKEMHSEIFFADQLVPCKFIQELADEIPLKGFYQKKNIATSYQAIRLLIVSGFRITEENIHHGYKNVIRQTGLQGRWQLIPGQPRTICDVGHNEAGIRYILEQLKTEKFKRLHWVFGLVNDKDSSSILQLLPESTTYYFCKANIPRGLDAAELREKASLFGLKGEVYNSVDEAFQAAKNAAGDQDLVFVGGSTFIVAEVI